MGINVRTINKNARYIVQQLSALLQNTSKSVKIICTLIIVTYLFSFNEDCIQFLSVIPGYVTPPTFRIWTAFTFCFLEVHLWDVIVDLLVLGFCEKLIEPLWGSAEMKKFFIITNLGVAILTSLFYLSLFIVTGNPDLLFKIHINGLAGFIAGITVAVKQVMPDSVLIKVKGVKFTHNGLPLFLSTLSLLFWFVGFTEGTSTTMIIFGVMASWTYLRFYQKHSNGTKGDITDRFSFASLFPKIIQPFISLVSNIVYKLLVFSKICKKGHVNNLYTISAESERESMLERQDMERRKQMALKALSERLGRSNNQPLPPPSPVSSMQKSLTRSNNDTVVTISSSDITEDDTPTLSIDSSV